MGRVGKFFSFGAPQFYNGLEYNWPDEKLDYNGLFMERRDELGDILIEKLKQYIEEFDVFISGSSYPYLQKGMKGLALYLGDGGRWIEIWKMAGAGFLGCHNLDSYKERAAGFNIGSDLLERLDPTVLAPRVSISEGGYLMRFPLPQGLDIITNPLLTEELVRRVYSLVDFNEELRLTNGNGVQRIENSNGVVVIQKGMCEGRDFKKWDVPKASWAISRLISLCGEAV